MDFVALHRTPSQKLIIISTQVIAAMEDQRNGDRLYTLVHTWLDKLPEILVDESPGRILELIEQAESQREIVIG